MSNKPSGIKRFFGVIFMLLSAGITILFIATLLGYTDLHAGKLAIAGMIIWTINGKLASDAS